MDMLNWIDNFRKAGERIHHTQDQEGHWVIEERKQQDPDIENIEPLVIHIGKSHIDHFATNEKKDISHPKVGIIGIGDSQKELIHVLKHIVAEEGNRQIIIIGGISEAEEIKELTLSDFAEKIIEDTRKEIFCIKNTLQNEIRIEERIKETNKQYQKQTKYHNKFHNQKPSGAKGQYARRGRK